MRRRGPRIFGLVVVIVAISIAALSFRDIHVGAIDRENDGPLGLKLGLDLQGGVMLWYQADLPDEVSATFQEKVSTSEVRSLLDGEGHLDAVIAVREFTIAGLNLKERSQELLKSAMEGLGGHLVPETGDSTVEVRFVSEDLVEVDFPNEVATGDVRSFLEALGYTSAEVATEDDKAHVISGLALEETSIQAFRQSLADQLSLTTSFDTVESIHTVTFQDPVLESELRSTLDELGAISATIDNPDQTFFNITGLDVDQESELDLRAALEGLAAVVNFRSTINEPDPDDMKGVRDIIERRVNALGTTEPVIQTLGEDRVVIQIPGLGGAVVDVTFLGTPTAEALESLLAGTGHTTTGDVVDPGTEPNSVVIRKQAPLPPEELASLKDLIQTISPSAGFLVSGDQDNEIVLTFPPSANQASLVNLMTGLGHTDFTVSQQSAQFLRFVINTDEALTTEEQDELREAMVSGFGNVSAFQASGGIEEAKRLIRGTAQLVFKERVCTVSLDELNAAGVAGLPSPCEPVERGGGGRYVDTDLGLTGNDLDRAFTGVDNVTGQPRVHLEFNNKGRTILREVTTRIAGNELARLPIFLDGVQLTSPVVRSPILNGNPVIEGGFTRDSANTLAIQLESGRLPVPLKLLREDTVDAILGADSLRKSLIAGLVGLGLVLVFMVVYYKMAGVVAATALLIYAVIILAIFKLIPITLTLSGIAGVIISIGMAVDANVLIFERMKEELRTGRTLASSMEVGFRRAWTAIRDGNTSTIITCLILWWFGSRLGTPVITGLAITLLIGVIVSMFTALLVSRNLLTILTFTPLGRKISLFTPEPRRQPVGVAGGDK